MQVFMITYGLRLLNFDMYRTV